MDSTVETSVDASEGVSDVIETPVETPAPDSAVESTESLSEAPTQTTTEVTPSGDDEAPGDSVSDPDDPVEEETEEPASPEPARDTDAELSELQARHDEELASIREASAALDAQNAELKAQLLDMTIQQVSTNKNLKIASNKLRFLDRSLLVNADGLPDQSAIADLVTAFGEAPRQFKENIGVGPQGGSGSASPYDGYASKGGSSGKLDARNRFNPLRRK